MSSSIDFWVDGPGLVPCRSRLGFVYADPTSRYHQTMTDDAQAVIVDGHVHLYSKADRDTFLDHALANFKRVKKRLGLGNACGCLFLLDKKGQNNFALLQDKVTASTGPWKFYHTVDQSALWAVRGDATRVLLVGGRQIRTLEGLEVLSVGSLVEIGDGLTVDEVIARVKASKGLPIIPWAFGKWRFRRRRRIRRIIATQSRAPYLGDKPRPIGFREHRILREARRRGILCLPGTDPEDGLNQAVLIGSSGLVLKGTLNAREPFTSLTGLLAHSRGDALQFGMRSPLGQFCKTELRRQLRKFAQLLSALPADRYPH